MASVVSATNPSRRRLIWDDDMTTQNASSPMTGDDFVALLLFEFPALTLEVNEYDGLLHVQMHVFSRHTQEAIDSGDMQVLDRCFALAHHGFRDADSALKNAFYVSYLEHLNFAGTNGAASKRRMTSLLQSGLTEIIDYMEQFSRHSKNPK